MNIYFQQKHQEIDEWASYEHKKLDYFDPGDDDGHYYIDQEAKEKHDLLDEQEYYEASYIDQEFDKEHSILEQGEFWEEENFIRSNNEIYNAIERNERLSPSNPFLTLLLD